ncbi:trypsin-like serine protease [Streptomyces griseofuscus]|uniref:trypsin-like serine protease n=1 Tax=Streptomyces griseofuscus TaxID=146922 RepID=UPI0034332E27
MLSIKRTAVVTTAAASLTFTASAAFGAPAGTAPASHAPSAKLTAKQIAGLPSVQQNRLLDPLRRIAAALDTAGTQDDPAIYSSLSIDAPAGVVHLYVTDPAQSASLIRAAKKRDPRIRTGSIDVRKARYTLTQLHAARSALYTQQQNKKLQYRLSYVAVEPDSSGLEVGTPDPDQAATAPAPLAPFTGDQAPVEIRFVKAAAVRPTAWRDTKWSDSAPYIGGDSLVGPDHADGPNYLNRCTAGLPAVRNSDGKQALLTAAHCYRPSDRIYTHNPPAPATGKFYTAPDTGEDKYVGTVDPLFSYYYDAEELVGSSNNADISDSTSWKPIASTAYSYNGDYVCQDGIASFFMGFGTVCGIEVKNQDITYTIVSSDGKQHTTRGVEGTRLPTNDWAVAEGDSGGMVYADNGSSVQARGIVSAGHGTTTEDPSDASNYIEWTEVPDILKDLNLKLNPAK